LFTIKQAVKRFGIPKSTLYRYIKQNKLRTIRNPFGKGIIVLEGVVSGLGVFFGVCRAKKKGGEG